MRAIKVLWALGPVAVLLAGCSAGAQSEAAGRGARDAGAGDASVEADATVGDPDASDDAATDGAADDGATEGATDAGADTAPGCTGGKLDCNADGADGCEVDPSGDKLNCGDCSVVCPDAQDGTALCIGGTCALACTSGRSDCDHDVTTGCETDVTSDPANCGGCNKSCGTAACISGACACASTTQTAAQLPLDLYFMFDQSGSMDTAVGSGGTAWDAVRSAFSAFVADPKSAGMGVGTQFFPPGSDASCFSDSDCGNGLSCVGVFLFLPGTCGVSNDCPVGLYSKPKLAITLLPAGAGAVTGSFNGQAPVGADTPTGPALAGAIAYAKGWATANPLHKVAVVLATDGEPNACSPSDIPGIAALASAAYASAPSVPSFVIGVGSSLSNLDAIAKAGSGNQTGAFLVDTGGNAVQQFEAALEAIRGKLLGCDYAPPTSSGGTPDYSKVNVQTTVQGAVSKLATVAGAGGCDPTAGGWYYDNPAAPTKITLCPVNCTAVQADPNAQVDIEVGCPSRQ